MQKSAGIIVEGFWPWHQIKEKGRIKKWIQKLIQQAYST